SSDAGREPVKFRDCEISLGCNCFRMLEKARQNGRPSFRMDPRSLVPISLLSRAFQQKKLSLFFNSVHFAAAVSEAESPFISDGPGKSDAERIAELKEWLEKRAVSFIYRTEHFRNRKLSGLAPLNQSDRANASIVHVDSIPVSPFCRRNRGQNLVFKARVRGHNERNRSAEKRAFVNVVRTPTNFGFTNRHGPIVDPKL